MPLHITQGDIFKDTVQREVVGENLSASNVGGSVPIGMHWVTPQTERKQTVVGREGRGKLEALHYDCHCFKKEQPLPAGVF